MLPDFSASLHQMATVIVDVGLNLQSGQRIIIADPYELQGVARSAEVIVNAVRSAATRREAPEMPVDVIWGNPAQLRGFTEQRDWDSLKKLVAANARRMTAALEHGDALLFLTGSQPRLMDGVPADAVAQGHRIAWEYFGPIAQQLTAGATNWTAAPAPSPSWAAQVFEFLPADQRLTALWTTVFNALRCGARAPGEPDAVARWTVHLQTLAARRDLLNAARHTRLRYRGAGTDIAVELPRDHVWCTAQLTTRAGVPFVANLPTEEIFTAPDKSSARGIVRVARPILQGGAVIDGITLTFDAGDVVEASAETGADLLERLIDTDDGARRLGEVALVETPAWAGTTGGLFHHVLFDENAAAHIALGEAYSFCSSRPGEALNRSLLHVDLPIAAEAQLE